jgi:hypothetical protein
MSQIVGAEGLSPAELRAELERGGRLIVFSYAVSVCVLTWGSDSPPHLVRKGESAFFKGLKYTLLTLVAGWWGLPFGPFFTLAALYANLSGGEDVTARALPPPPPPEGGEPAPGPPLPSWKEFKEQG